MFKRAIATLVIVGALFGASAAVAPTASAGSTEGDCIELVVRNLTRILF